MIVALRHHRETERIARVGHPIAFAVGHSGRNVDDYYAREVVLDAFGDT